MQTTLFDRDDFLRHCCPSCRSTDVIAIDLDQVGECQGCNAVLWRDDDASPWERTATRYGVGMTRPVLMRSPLLDSLRRLSSDVQDTGS